MKILIVHGYNNYYPSGRKRIRNWILRLRSAGIEVSGYEIPIRIKGMRLPWFEMDYLWKNNNKQLLFFYEDLAKVSEGYDALINFGGINIHPDFLQQLRCITILWFNDDPESSEYYSRPIANYYDLCLVGNIAEVSTYKNWGVKRVFWQPLGFWDDDYDSKKSVEMISKQERDISIILMCERLTQFRKKNVDRFSKAFPSGLYYGNGWPNGFLPESMRIPYLQRTKIGINIHNTTGPINYRTYYLPANGVLQICDNKKYLNSIFELGKEVIGYDNINDAIELTKYYLNHDLERQEIAMAGFKRAIDDYNEVAVFSRIIKHINNHVDELSQNSHNSYVKQENNIFGTIIQKMHPVERFCLLVKFIYDTIVFKTLNFYTHKIPRFLTYIENCIK